ncbi:PIN-like domain-containing protein [Pseudomonas mosselii]|uniref:PIN-like domain-containing protein n=1 Tax=Pseudomonas mosselii TaxID=78327 RepID=UPI0021633EFF|nr:PIN-like domain-containing protein [Pseudomonas mosselii]UVN43324.1 PIN domain-containing protein [Pseudomonas mosselii]
MKATFPGQFANDPEDLKRLWADSMIVVDANVLLGLYRYSENTKNEFLEVFGRLKERLWIPHQVAKEYFKNRLNVISVQAKKYDEAIDGLSRLRIAFEDAKQHPFVSAEVLGDCTKSFELIIGELRSNREKHDSKITNDDVKDAISELFCGRVGQAYPDARLDEIIVEGQGRYESNVPPGFKDTSKGNDKTFEGRLAPYGDLIVWLQLLDKAKAEAKSVIFVTADKKEDWWLDQSGKTIGPQPQLIEEFISVTSKRFYMYQPDRFLRMAGEFLQRDVSDEAVQEVRNAVLMAANDPEPVPDESLGLSQSDLRAFKNYLERSFLKADGTHRSTDGLLSLEASYASLLSDMYDAQKHLDTLADELNKRLVDGPSELYKSISDEAIQNAYENWKNRAEDLRGLIDENRRLRQIWKHK